MARTWPAPTQYGGNFLKGYALCDIYHLLLGFRLVMCLDWQHPRAPTSGGTWRNRFNNLAILTKLSASVFIMYLARVQCVVTHFSPMMDFIIVPSFVSMISSCKMSLCIICSSSTRLCVSVSSARPTRNIWRTLDAWLACVALTQELRTSSRASVAAAMDKMMKITRRSSCICPSKTSQILLAGSNECSSGKSSRHRNKHHQASGLQHPRRHNETYWFLVFQKFHDTQGRPFHIWAD